MHINDYYTILNNHIPIYLNKRGVLTIDQKYHEVVYKLFIINNWDKYSGLVGPARLWSIIENITSDDGFIFDRHGLQLNPPAYIVLLETAKRRRDMIEILNTREGGDTTSVVTHVVVSLCIVMCLFCSWLLYDNDDERVNQKQIDPKAKLIRGVYDSRSVSAQNKQTVA